MLNIRHIRYIINIYDPVECVEKSEVRSNETLASMLTLIYQIDAMLAKVLKSLEAGFMAEGGIREPCAVSDVHSAVIDHCD